MEALKGQMIAEIFNSSDNHKLILIDVSCQKSAPDDPAVFSSMTQDSVCGDASVPYAIELLNCC